MEPSQEIRDKNLERVAQNSQKMKELETQMLGVENKIEKIKTQTKEIKVNEKTSKDSVYKIYQDTLKHYEEYNKPLQIRVNNRFIAIFDEISRRLNDAIERRTQLEDQHYSLSKLLKELESTSKDEEERDKKIDEEIDEKISEIEFLEKNYNDTSKDNIELGKILSEKNNAVAAGEAKLLELKAIIGKLTEVRVTLNKYFSSHFENFTKGEQALIGQVKDYRLKDSVKAQETMEEIIKEGEFGYGPRSTHEEKEEVMDQFGQYQQVNNLGLGNNIDPNADYNNRYDDVNINQEE